AGGDGKRARKEHEPPGCQESVEDPHDHEERKEPKYDQEDHEEAEDYWRSWRTKPVLEESNETGGAFVDSDSVKFEWEIRHLSSQPYYIFSEEFKGCGGKWKVKFYPEWKVKEDPWSSQSCKYASVFLQFDGSKDDHLTAVRFRFWIKNFKDP